MQTKNPTYDENTTQSGRFTKRIGSTLYDVRVFSCEEESEPLMDKFIRLATNDALCKGSVYGNVEELRTGRLPEGGSP
jgi:hypothetical protein